MADQRLIIGNWKMNGSRVMMSSLVPPVIDAASVAVSRVRTVLCPPSIWLSEMAAHLSSSCVSLGAQDCHEESEGAFTGDVSASMLREAGCDYVILGHSERRQYHAEIDAQVALKASTAVKAGLIPVICVGETLELRQMGEAEAFVAKQLLASVPNEMNAPFVIAYEPIWAIGTGHVPTSDDIIRMHDAIATVLAETWGEAGAKTPILYGGSVKAANAKEILDLPRVGGVLVGGASLIAEQFCAIVAAAD
jgi:triosephosphate isomerase